MFWLAQELTGTASDKLRSLLAPKAGIGDDDLTQAKAEISRIEKSILVMKTQIANHPMEAKKSAARLAEQNREIDGQAAMQLLEMEIQKVEEDIGKYVTVLKSIIADLSEVYGLPERDVLLKLSVSRTVQSLLL